MHLLDTCDPPENFLMECVKNRCATRALPRAIRPLVPENVFLELAKGFEPPTL